MTLPMRDTLLTTVLLVAFTLGLVGCQTSRGTLVGEAPRARATSSPGFQPRAHEKIAVLVRDNADDRYWRETGVRRQVEDVFAQMAARRGYRLATRSQVAAIKDEIRFESDTTWTRRGGAEPGNLYNVSALLIVSIDEAFVREEPGGPDTIPDPDRDSFIGRLLDNVLDAAPDETYYAESSVSASLISVGEAEVLWRGRYTGAMRIREEQPGSRAIPAVAQVVAEALPAR
jgi:hypothetical protein